MYKRQVQENYRYLSMDGKEVFRFAVGAMEEAIRHVVDESPWKLEDIDLFIPHQANIRILANVARHMKLSMDRFYVNLDRFGNKMCIRDRRRNSSKNHSDMQRDGDPYCGSLFHCR